MVFGGVGVVLWLGLQEVAGWVGMELVVWALKGGWVMYALVSLR